MFYFVISDDKMEMINRINRLNDDENASRFGNAMDCFACGQCKDVCPHH